jgi:hypothetical protein
MHLRALIILSLLVPLTTLRATSATYSLTPETLDSGGIRGSSANYTADFSTTPGVAGSSAQYIARSGYAGQLVEPSPVATRLTIASSPATVNELGTRQLSARADYDDASAGPIPASSVTWSVQSGPITGIDTSGLVTAGTVYQDTGATVSGAYAGVSGTYLITVLDTVPDNYGTYAHDGLPDSWQVRYFGTNSPAAAPTANLDGDGYNNLLEFAFGTDPVDSSSGPGGITYSGGVITHRGQPALSVTNITNSVDFRAVFGRRKDYLALGLKYQVQFSGDLVTWTNSTATPTVLASDSEMNAVSVPYPLFLPNGRKARFFRVNVTVTP